MGFIIKVAFIDISDELSEAVAAIISAEKEGRSADAQKAYAVLSNMDMLTLANVRSKIGPTLDSRNTLEIIELQNNLSKVYRERYIKAKKLATGQK